MLGIRSAFERYPHDRRAGFVKLHLLLDENLPDGLSHALGEPCTHAIELGNQPTDETLWRHAQREGCVILTKDVDFFNKLAMQGAPPKVVWIRTGNMRRTELVAFLAHQWPRIRRLLDHADLVEVHRDRLESIKF